MVSKTGSARQANATDWNRRNTVVKDDIYRLEKNQMTPSPSKKVKLQQVARPEFSISSPFIFLAIGER